jgi:voltage-gated potassium channel
MGLGGVGKSSLAWGEPLSGMAIRPLRPSLWLGRGGLGSAACRVAGHLGADRQPRDPGVLERRRHRFYRLLLLVCLALMGTLVLPGHWSLLLFPGYLLLTLIVSVALRGALAGGPPRLSDRLYPLLGLTVTLAQIYWLLLPHHARVTGVPLAIAFSVFFFWTLQRLVGALALERRVSRRVVGGALAGYLLLGLCGGLLLCVIESLQPGSFRSALDGNDPLMRGGALPQASPLSLIWERNFLRVNYFAFVSLTTVGYGDIIPVQPLAQMISLSLSIIGPVYIAVVMGVLISRLTSEWGGPFGPSGRSEPPPPPPGGSPPEGSGP